MTSRMLADGSWVDDSASFIQDSSAFAAPATTSSTAQGRTAAASAALGSSNVSASQATEIAYLSGITGSGALAARSFATDMGGYAHKWGVPIAGRTGGVVTFSFVANEGQTFTGAEQATLRQCIALWSAVCSITFKEVATGGAVSLERNTDGNANTSDVYTRLNTSSIGANSSSVLTIDTSSYGFDLSGSFTQVRGYGLGTAIHELGHVLGLGHAGDYDGSANSSTDQYSAFDSRQWSLMSYINATDSSAAYASQYTVTGTNWGGAENPTTMQILDIAAVQEMYGLPTAGPLSAGGQVFGFNTNISGLGSFYDFTVNASPVVTLWDGGVGNTLDLSGYSAASAVNLNPGTFSSVNGLVNDIGIAFNTAIDTAIGGSGNDTFILNADADTIYGEGGTDTAVFSGARADYALSRAGSTVTATGHGVTSTLHDISVLRFADVTMQSSDLACFVHGTRIAVPAGEVPVETLAIADLVLTADGQARPVRWLGRRSFAARFAAANPAIRPVLIRAGALGGGLPRHDLRLSRNHALLIDGHLVPAGELVDGDAIRTDRTAGPVHYVHIELADHDAVLAEGVPAETFVAEEGRALFHNAAEYAALYGDDEAAPGYAAPRLTHGPVLDGLRRRLAGLRGTRRSA